MENTSLEIIKYIKDLKEFEQIRESKDAYKVREKSTEEIYEVVEIQIENPEDDREKKERFTASMFFTNLR